MQIALHIITRAQERYVNNSSNWNVILCIHLSIYLLPSVFLSGYAQTFVSKITGEGKIFFLFNQKKFSRKLSRDYKKK